MKTETYRIAAGIFICPWILAAAWSVPYLEHSALAKWVMINTVLAFIVFIFTASISHIILRVLSAVKWWQYPAVMFIVCILLYFGLSTWSASGYMEFYHSQTQVVKNGSITSAGYALNLKNAVLGALLSASVFLLFWVIAVWKPRSRGKNA